MYFNFYFNLMNQKWGYSIHFCNEVMDETGTLNTAL